MISEMARPGLLVTVVLIVLSPTVLAGGTLEICKLEVPELLKTARFQATIKYNLRTDASGKVGEVSLIPGQEREAFQPVWSSLSTCLRNWELQPEAKYVLSLNWGTTRQPTTYEVCDEARKCLKLEVPRTFSVGR